MYEVYKFSKDQWTLIPSSFDTFKDAIEHITGQIVHLELDHQDFKVWIEQHGDVNQYKVVNKE